MRISRTIAVAAGLLASRAQAQAPSTGFLVLLLPASARATALGNAWVAGRDDYSIFSNPAQIAPTNGIGGSFARYGPGAVQGALSGAATVGSLTFGWGAQLAELRVGNDATYPFVPAMLTSRGSRSALSFVAAPGANRVFKGFRTGLAVKYAEDRLEGLVGIVGDVGSGVPARRLLADAGVSHNLLSGTAAVAVQNADDGSTPHAPLQVALGWARQFQPGQLDVGVATQVLERRGWVSPAGGVEVGYGWIEGWSATVRAGARRPETSAQRPLTLGGALNADRLALDYALEFFAGNRYGQHLAIRWR
jgi:hypothetical protein